MYIILLSLYFLFFLILFLSVALKLYVWQTKIKNIPIGRKGKYIFIFKKPSLDRGIQFDVLALTETHTRSTKHGVESGSKAMLNVPLCHFRTFLRYRRLIPLELVSDPVQSYDVKSELSFPFQNVSKIHHNIRRKRVWIKSQTSLNLF